MATELAGLSSVHCGNDGFEALIDVNDEPNDPRNGNEAEAENDEPWLGDEGWWWEEDVKAKENSSGGATNEEEGEDYVDSYVIFSVVISHLNMEKKMEEKDMVIDGKDG